MHLIKNLALASSREHPQVSVNMYLFSFYFCSYLLPHLLPPKPAMDIHGFRQQVNNTLQRLFKMSFVPAGFWERFIARMLISLTELDLQVLKPADSHHSPVKHYQLFSFMACNVFFAQSFEPKRNTRAQRSRNSVIYSFTGTQQRNRCSTFRVRRSQTIYWKEGLLVTFDGGYLRLGQSSGYKDVCGN